MQPILYLGDDDVTRAAIYLSGVLTHFGITFDRIDSNQSPDADFASKQYSLYILSDYPRQRFFPEQLEHIASAVKQGAGLLMIGGWESFHGKDGEYHNSPLVDVLPVKMSNQDDRRNSFQPLIIRKVHEHKMLEGLPWNDSPATIGGYNAIMPKSNSTVLLDAVRLSVQISGDAKKSVQVSESEAIPLLVVGQFGQGKTAALATDVAPHWVGGLVDWGDQRITQTVGNGFIEVGNHYAQFLRNLVLDLAKTA